MTAGCGHLFHGRSCENHAPCHYGNRRGLHTTPAESMSPPVARAETIPTPGNRESILLAFFGHGIAKKNQFFV